MHLEVPFHKNPLVDAAFWPARMTAFKVIGKFLWLFIWPARLSADYSYNSVPLFQWSFSMVKLGRLAGADHAVLCVAGIALALRLRREKSLSASLSFSSLSRWLPPRTFSSSSAASCRSASCTCPPSDLQVAASALFFALSRRFPHPAPEVPVGCSRALCLALGARTYARNFDRHDESTLWRSVTDVNPDDALAHVNLGNVLLEIPGRMPDAIAEYQNALRIYPNYAEAHNNLGAILLQSGRTTEAVAEYRAAVRLDPDYPDAHSNLGSALSRIPGRLPEAAAELETAVRLDPENARRRAALGNVLLQMPGRIPEAIGQLETAVKIDPELTDAHYSLAFGLAQIPGRLPDAVREFNISVERQARRRGSSLSARSGAVAHARQTSGSNSGNRDGSAYQTRPPAAGIAQSSPKGAITAIYYWRRAIILVLEPAPFQVN